MKQMVRSRSTERNTTGTIRTLCIECLAHFLLEICRGIHDRLLINIAFVFCRGPHGFNTCLVSAAELVLPTRI